MANSQGDRIAFASPRSSTWIVLNCILFVIVLDFCCVSIGDLTRDCLVFLKDRQVSRFGCFVFEFWVLRFRDLGASFSRFGCFVFEFWVLCFRDLGASCFGLRFWNYRPQTVESQDLVSPRAWSTIPKLTQNKSSEEKQLTTEVV